MVGNLWENVGGKLSTEQDTSPPLTHNTFC